MCVYRTNDGFCKLYSTDGVVSYCVDGPCKDEVQTNADRIRSMSDEELASALVKYEGTEKRPTRFGGHEHIFHGPNGETCGTKAYALQLWMEWLRQPAEEE